MTIKIKGLAEDGVKEACARLGIARPTLIRYIKSGYFTKPKRHVQGRGKSVRYFDAEWYRVNEKKLKADRKKKEG